LKAVEKMSSVKTEEGEPVELVSIIEGFLN